ncbi:MAG: hypothetical protein ABIC04_05955 [Nanoarchaeota archaeon]
MINKLYVLQATAIIFFLLLMFWIDHKDDTPKINQMQKTIQKLNSTNIELRTELVNIKTENKRLKKEQIEVYEELANYAALGIVSE